MEINQRQLKNIQTHIAHRLYISRTCSSSYKNTVLTYKISNSLELGRVNSTFWESKITGGIEKHVRYRHCAFHGVRSKAMPILFASPFASPLSPAVNHHLLCMGLGLAALLWPTSTCLVPHIARREKHECCKYQHGRRKAQNRTSEKLSTSLIAHTHVRAYVYLNVSRAPFFARD